MNYFKEIFADLKDGVDEWATLSEVPGIEGIRVYKAEGWANGPCNCCGNSTQFYWDTKYDQLLVCSVECVQSLINCI